MENEKTTNVYPVIPLRGKIAFPHSTLSFEVGRERTVKAVERASATDGYLFILTQRETEKDDVTEADLYDAGCVAKIKQVTRLQNGGGMRVLCEILYRAKARVISLDSDCFTAVCDPIRPVHGDPVLEEAHFRTAKAFAKELFSSDGKITKEQLATLERCEDADLFVDVLLTFSRMRLELKQRILGEANVVKRLRDVEQYLNDELEITAVERKIANAVRQSTERNQKDYYLREQIKAIKKELGDEGNDGDEYRAKILDKKLPKEVEVKCLKEVDRLERTPSASAEYSIILTYLDQVLALPWTEETTDTEKLSDCQKILDSDHYGLEKIKERITEYLAVLKLTSSMKAPILCFVGPPGVGKTSIARSIARALNRKFVRMSLGGVKDEAEIRGHRRTYIGAQAGRILYAMKEAGSVNPVFLFDEIDKIGADMQGDPASALLEVLDPEQNSTFRDRFLELPYDLSKVLFLTTANSLEGIPAPLRDRMEIVELSGYTLEEKSEIAKRYLVPKQLERNGLTEQNAKFTPAGIKFAVEGYTREAGVRRLERTIGSICRKIAVQYAKNKKLPQVRVDKEEVVKLLGNPRFLVDEEKRAAEVGAVNGLAWTAVGGTTLTVEVIKSVGKGEIKLTGKLGDVMKESALTALSYIRAHADEYDVNPSIFDKIDLHIHVPEGATPKDGPSAGITIATAILSALTGRRARGDIAMTGEITLRGKVLPIGGLKEKALAARRVGIKEVILPVGNVRDLDELPTPVRKEITFHPVKSVEEVFALALLDAKPTEKRQEKRLPSVQNVSHEESVRCID